MKYVILIIIISTIIVMYYQYQKTADFKLRYADIFFEEEFNMIRKIESIYFKQIHLKQLEEKVINAKLPIDIEQCLISRIKKEYNK